jgi:hypothetical protein
MKKAAVKMVTVQPANVKLYSKEDVGACSYTGTIEGLIRYC